MEKIKKWKYAKAKKKIDFEEYFILPENKKYKITVKNWMFTDGYVDGYSRTVFRTDVINIDGKETNKIMVIKNYDNVQQLKKALAKKKGVKATANFEITRFYNKDEMDYYFDIKILN